MSTTDTASQSMLPFQAYSTSTVRAFIDYIYLGGPKFMEKVLSSKNADSIDLFELFEFAACTKLKLLSIAVQI